MRLLVTLLMVCVVSVSGQSVDSDREFDFISIKPRGATPLPPRNVGPEVFRRPNSSLFTLLTYSYSVIGAHIVGVPDWGRKEYWEVEARAPFKPNPEEMRGMVRRLLVDRFSLRTRFETREADVYELILANRDGRFGPNVKPSTTDCEQAILSGDPRETSKQGPCAQEILRTVGKVTVHYRGYRIQRLAQFLELELQRAVIDKTNRSGPFDFAFSYLPTTINFTPTTDTVPALKTALREQLGLALRPARAPVRVLVIESVSRPTAN